MLSTQLESYFPPAAPIGTATREEATAGSRPVLRTAGGDHPISSLPARKKKQKQGTSSSDIPIDEEDMQTAILLNNRDLEIYVTLPSAEKRLFVDVQEEIAVSSVTSHKAKKRKVGHHAADGKKESGKKVVREGQAEEGGKREREKGKGKGKSASTSTPSALASKDPNVARGQSAAASSSKPTASKDAKENKSASASSKIMSSKSTTTEKGKQTEIASASDKLTDPTASGALVPATSISPDSEDDDVIKSLLRRPGTSNEKDEKTTTSSDIKPQEESRLPYSSFEHVKLNVRVRPPTAGSNKKRKNSDSTGVDISAIDRKIAQPKVLDRFPIRISGSTILSRGVRGLQDTFELSVQGSTQISSLLVLLYTRIKLAQEQEYRIPSLNSIRLWSLNEDSLVRLSRGTVASNSITPRSILVYTIGKRTGKSHVFTYADASKVKKVAVEVQVSNIWQGKDPSHGVEKSVPPGATRRQLYKTKALVSQTSTSSKKSKSSAEVRKKSPHVTAFTFDIIGEQSKIPSPMDIACDAAREDHFERKAERERLRAEREQERVKEVARLEKHRQRLLKKSKNGTTMDIGVLANDGFVSVHTLDESSGGSNALSTGNGEREKALKSEESEWDTECFYEDYLDTHGPPDDDRDDHLPFQAWRAEVEMKESVLLATGPCSAASAPVATAVEKSAKNTDEATLDPGSDDIAVPTVQIGVEHILRVLGVPDSASRVFIEDMVKATSPYPYIALTLIKYEDVAFGMDIEARYEPIAESNALWDIRDVQQVCLVYKGVWKSEMEDWKKGCRTLTEVDWSKIALGINAWGSDKSASPATSATATSAARAAGAAASTNNIVTTAAASAPSVATSSAIYSAEDRFLNYRARTKHLRHRTCPNCESCGCTLSRVPEGAHGCECGECYGSDAEDDGEEYYKYGHEEAGNASLSTSSSSTSSSTSTTSTSSSSASAVSASTATTSTSSASGKSRPSSTAEKETVASVLVRGHRARVVQCIYLEAF